MGTSWANRPIQQMLVKRPLFGIVLLTMGRGRVEKIDMLPTLVELKD